jgi:uncharacterized protein YdhG (YjbR/CyaY superfamily)
MENLGLEVGARMKKAKSNSKALPKNVDEYLAGVPEPSRGALQKIRVAIQSVVPSGATETISYGMPAFKYKGILV